MTSTKSESSPTCDHSYTRSSGMTFRCDTNPHPAKPDAHYFVRDREAEARRLHPDAKVRGSLIVIPGERR